jgi:allantoinase
VIGPLRDPGHFDYAPYRGRPKIVWPGGARIAFWLAPNIEHYELEPPDNPIRKPWPRPVPDILNYSFRDYGNRVGFDRMADVMERHGVRGSVSLSVAVCDHFPEIIARCNALGWELFSHGVYNSRYFYGMSAEEQRQVIRDSRETLARFGQTLDGWLTPAITPTDETQHLLAEEGITYTLDLVNDDQPMPMRVRKGRLISIPYSYEVNDVPVLQWRNISTGDYEAMLKAQFDQLYAEGERSGTVMCIPIHPFLMGMPHRTEAFGRVLDYVTSHEGVWCATGREIARHFNENYYEAFADWLASVPGNGPRIGGGETSGREGAR